MQIRRFRAQDMRQAIRKVRDAVGPDAVILSNQRLASGEIEIVAALDYDGSLPSSIPSKSNSPSAKVSEPTSQFYQERIKLARESSPSESIQSARKPQEVVEDPILDESLSIKQRAETQDLKKLEHELSKVKEQLKQQTASSVDSIDLDPMQAKVKERLIGLGLSTQLITSVLDDVDLNNREDDWNRVLAHLAESIPVKKQPAELQGCFAFMGPTGVGKTTTIGKIAAQHVLKYGPEGVVLITTDTYRIAAHEQLRTFGRILNVPVVVVNEYTDLNTVLDKYKSYSLVLVDTAGMNPRDRNLERQLLMVKRAPSRLKKLLVLPCTSQRQVLKTVLDVYAQVQLDGCVLSKLDESASLGEVISVVIEESLPVVYLADGQRIPDDIQPARAHNIISRAVYTAEQYSHIYSTLKYGS
ncbi:flagellar biosynthesis protein FlhF [Marinomonas agarivorans]|nr:flagellar biosynthesis protein FlhF [Marinomonas agarivorans]